jgi:putative flippase GtrA
VSAEPVEAPVNPATVPVPRVQVHTGPVPAPVPVAPGSAAGRIRWEAPGGDGDAGEQRATAVRARVRDLVVRRQMRLPGWLRFSRYTVGSAICFGVSEVVFVALFAPGLLGSKGAAIVASIAGIIPAYFLNRSWTWGRRGRSDFWREVVPYWATALVSTLLAALGTGAANALFADEPRGVRTLINAVAYMLVYGVLFVVKYVIFHRWLFAPPAPSSAEPHRP